MLLDVSPSMYYPEQDFGKLHFSVKATAALAYLLSKQRDAVGVYTFDDKIQMKTEIKSTGVHISNLIQSLGKILHSNPTKSGKTNIAPVLHTIAETLHKRSMIIIFSDFFDRPYHTDAIFNALNHLKYKQHEIIVFHVRDASTEDELNFENRPYQFVDIESGQKIKLLPSQAVDEYKKIISNWNEKIKMKCGQYKIDYIPADIRLGFRQILMPFFLKRSKMG